MQSIFLKLLPLLLTAVVGSVLFLAWYSPQDKPLAPQAVRAPFGRHEAKFTLARDASLAAPPERVTPASAPSPTPETILPAPAAGIVRKYRASSDVSARLGLLHDLADDEQSGRAGFIQLFGDEKDDALKTTMLNLSETVGEPTQDLYTLLDMGMQPSQPADVRDAAERILAQNPGTGALPVWQHLLTDADPGIREVAAQQVAQLQGQQ